LWTGIADFDGLSKSHTPEEGEAAEVMEPNPRQTSEPSGDGAAVENDGIGALAPPAAILQPLDGAESTLSAGVVSTDGTGADGNKQRRPKSGKKEPEPEPEPSLTAAEQRLAEQLQRLITAATTTMQAMVSNAADSAVQPTRADELNLRRLARVTPLSIKVPGKLEVNRTDQGRKMTTVAAFPAGAIFQKQPDLPTTPSHERKLSPDGAPDAESIEQPTSPLHDGETLTVDANDPHPAASQHNMMHINPVSEMIGLQELSPHTKKPKAKSFRGKPMHIPTGRIGFQLDGTSVDDQGYAMQLTDDHRVFDPHLQTMREWAAARARMYGGCPGQPPASAHTRTKSATARGGKKSVATVLMIHNEDYGVAIHHKTPFKRLMDGSGTIFWPSGNMAISISSTKSGQYVSVFADEDATGGGGNLLRFHSTPSGHGSILREDGSAIVMYTPHNVTLNKENGSETAKWDWEATPSMMPFDITPGISVRLGSPDGVKLSMARQAQQHDMVVTPRSCFVKPQNLNIPLSNVEFRARALCKDAVDRMNVAMSATYSAMHAMVLSAKVIRALSISRPTSAKAAVKLSPSPQNGEPGGIGGFKANGDLHDAHGQRSNRPRASQTLQSGFTMDAAGAGAVGSTHSLQPPRKSQKAKKMTS
jgi:hypothetical protein